MIAMVMSDLYKAGYTEDGVDYLAEMYYVVVELADGTRYIHDKSFLGAEQRFDDEGNAWFEDVREEAKAVAEKLAKRVQAAIDNSFDNFYFGEYWREGEPAYGSDAYINSGTEQRRRQEEMMEG